MTHRTRLIAAQRRHLGHPVRAPKAGAVYRVHRDRGLTPVGVFTGDLTPGGRLRFEVVDRKMGESSRFACTGDAVLAELAPSLEAWVRRCDG